MRSVLVGLAIAMSSAAVAQDVDAVPSEVSVEAVGPEEVFDILGIRFGMNAEQAESALGKPLKSLNGRILLTNPNTGATFDHVYPAALVLDAEALDAAPSSSDDTDELVIELGTEAVDGRIISVQRTIHMHENTPFTAVSLTNQLTKKYGDPSGINAEGTSLVWIYTRDGYKLELPIWTDLLDENGLMDVADSGAQPGDDLAPPPCALTLRAGVSDGLFPYVYKTERELRDPDCGVVLMVKFIGEDTVERIGLYMVDGQRRVQNALGFDAALKEAFDQEAMLREPEF